MARDKTATEVQMAMDAQAQQLSAMGGLSATVMGGGGRSGHLADALSNYASGSATMAMQFHDIEIQYRVLSYIAGGKKLMDSLKIIEHGKKHSIVHTGKDELVTFSVDGSFSPTIAADFMAWAVLLK